VEIIMKNAWFFNNFCRHTSNAAYFNQSRRLIEIRRASDCTPLRMYAASGRFNPIIFFFILVLCSVLIKGCICQRRTEPPPDEALRSAIEENVQDETRRAELLVLSERFSQILEELVAATNATSQKLDKFLLDYDSDRAAFERTFERYNQKRQTLGKRTIALHFEIKALVTPAEWESIEAAMLKLASSQTAVRLRRR
jgi:hypothetical protein